MIDYHSISDEELVSYGRNNDSSAEEELVRRYMKKVRICARRFFLLGGDNDDLIQDGMLGLLQAIRTFSEDTGTSFNTYAESCIRNRLIDAVGFSGYSGFLSSEEIDLSDYESPSGNPENELIEIESYNEKLALFKKHLSRYEKSVLMLFLKGYSCSDISSETGKSMRSVYNCIQRIRFKLGGQH